MSPCALVFVAGTGEVVGFAALFPPYVNDCHTSHHPTSLTAPASAPTRQRTETHRSLKMPPQRLEEYAARAGQITARG